MNERLILIDPIDHQRPTSPHIPNRHIRDLFHTRSLYYHIEAIWIIVFEFLPLRIGVLAVKLDVFVTSLELARDVHLDAFVSGDNDTGSTVKLEELCEDKSSRSCAKEKDLDADGGVEFVEAVYCACSWF
jgi:hypothetical protein